MSTKELTSFYNQHYQEIQKEALNDNVEEYGEFAKLIEKNKTNMIDMIYFDFVKSGFEL